MRNLLIVIHFFTSITDRDRERERFACDVSFQSKTVHFSFLIHLIRITMAVCVWNTVVVCGDVVTGTQQQRWLECMCVCAVRVTISRPLFDQSRAADRSGSQWRTRRLWRQRRRRWPGTVRFPSRSLRRSPAVRRSREILADRGHTLHPVRRQTRMHWQKQKS